MESIYPDFDGDGEGTAIGTFPTWRFISVGRVPENELPKLCPWCESDQHVGNCRVNNAKAAAALTETKRFDAYKLYIPSGDEIGAMVIEPIRWVVEGILPEGITLFSAKPKAGKSWLALGLTLAVVNGGRILDLQADPGEALYLALEDGYRRIQNRLAMMGTPRPAGAYFPIDWPRLNKGGSDALDYWLNRHPRATLVTLDTFQLVRREQGRGNPYAEDYAAMVELRQVARAHPGVAFLCVHHNRKMLADDPFDMASGTNGLMGGADTQWALVKDSGRVVLHTKGRDISERSIALTFDPLKCLWLPAGPAEPYANAPAIGDAQTFIKIKGSTSVADLADYLQVSQDRARHILHRLIADGVVERNGWGRYDSK
jgi:AAA domain